MLEDIVKKSHCEMCGARAGLEPAFNPSGVRSTLCYMCRLGSAELLHERHVSALDALDNLTAHLIEQHAEAGEYDGHYGDADHEGEAPEVCSYCAHIATARAVLAAAGRNVDHLTAR